MLGLEIGDFERHGARQAIADLNDVLIESLTRNTATMNSSPHLLSQLPKIYYTFQRIRLNSASAALSNRNYGPGRATALTWCESCESFLEMVNRRSHLFKLLPPLRTGSLIEGPWLSDCTRCRHLSSWNIVQDSSLMINGSQRASAR